MISGTLTLSDQGVGRLQFTGFLGSRTHALDAGAGSRQFVRMVLADQLAIGAFDQRRLASGLHAEQQQGLTVAILATARVRFGMTRADKRSVRSADQPSQRPIATPVVAPTG